VQVLWITALIVLLDQVTKILVKGISLPFLGIDHLGMPYGNSIPVLGDFFRITFIENPGMAFGIEVEGKVFLTLFSLLAGAAVVWYLYSVRNASLKIRVPLAMILGGAIGNFIDRGFYGVFYGYGSLFHGNVVDFFDLDFFDISIFGYEMTRWPVFNIADASVSIGVVLILLFHRYVPASDPLHGAVDTQDVSSISKDQDERAVERTGTTSS